MVVSTAQNLQALVVYAFTPIFKKNVILNYVSVERCLTLNSQRGSRQEGMKEK